MSAPSPNGSEAPAPAQQQGRIGPGNPPAKHRFKPGQSGNPAGARPGQPHPGRWLGPLSECTCDQLEQIVRDSRSSASKRAAARMLLDTAHPDFKVRFRAIVEVLNRTEGRPKARCAASHFNAETEQTRRPSASVPPRPAVTASRTVGLAVGAATCGKCQRLETLAHHKLGRIYRISQEHT